MNDKISKTIDEFISEFKNLECVKMYVKLKTELYNDNTFLALKEKRKQAQKTLALSLNSDTYQQKKVEFERIDAEYQSYPVYMNYLVYEQEVHHLLKEIENLLK